MKRVPGIHHAIDAQRVTWKQRPLSISLRKKQVVLVLAVRNVRVYSSILSDLVPTPQVINPNLLREFVSVQMHNERLHCSRILKITPKIPFEFDLRQLVAVIVRPHTQRILEPVVVQSQSREAMLLRGLAGLLQSDLESRAVPNWDVDGLGNQVVGLEYELVRIGCRGTNEIPSVIRTLKGSSTPVIGWPEDASWVHRGIEALVQPSLPFIEVCWELRWHEHVVSTNIRAIHFVFRRRRQSPLAEEQIHVVNHVKDFILGSWIGECIDQRFHLCDPVVFLHSHIREPAHKPRINVTSHRVFEVQDTSRAVDDPLHVPDGLRRQSESNRA
mmetsp:Transcript_7231/g.13304  ORF Transcript_7231/g.13304 Transcript_7231/m.13304 type:complete len:329 (+) Transcript_7231:540-1526(+)